MDLENGIKINGILNFDEHLDKKIESIGIYISSIILLGGLTFCISCFIYESINELLNYILNNLILIIITMSLCGLVILKCWMYRRKNLFLTSNISKEQLYIISDEGITREIGENLLSIEWSNVSKVIEKDNIFRIYFINNDKKPTFIPNKFFLKSKNVDESERVNPLYLPKRFFDNEVLIANFKEIFKKNNIRFIKFN